MKEITDGFNVVIETLQDTLDALMQTQQHYDKLKYFRRYAEDISYKIRADQIGALQKAIERENALAAEQPAVAQEPVAEVVSEENAGLYDTLPIGTKLYAEPPAVAVNEQMYQALVKTKEWFDAEENHDLEPDFYNRCGMCEEAQSLIRKAIAAAEAAKAGV